MRDEKEHSAARRYSELFLRHKRMIRWKCFLHAHGDPEQTEDYMQEVAIKLWHHIPDIKTDVSPRQERAYIKKAVDYVLSHCSRGKHLDQQQLRIELATNLSQFDSEDEQFLDALLADLPEGERFVVALFRSGYSLDEIAYTLSISKAAVTQRYHRAILKMRAQYKKEKDIINRLRHE